MLQHPRAPRRPKLELLAASAATLRAASRLASRSARFARSVIPKLELGNEGSDQTKAALPSPQAVAKPDALDPRSRSVDRPDSFTHSNGYK